MAYTTEQLQALEDALASGEKIVRFNDRWIEYRSVNELRQAISQVRASLGVESTTGSPRTRQLRMQTGKGF